MVRAKFECTSKKITSWAITYEFAPVTSGSEENEKFFATTPSGKVEITVKNSEVDFIVGKKYYLDFTEAEA